MNPPGTLASAIVLAQQAVKSVEKTSKNEFHKYKYAGTEAVLEEARAALSSAGLGVVPLGWSANEGRTVLHVTYRLLHVSGESMDFPCETPIIPDKGRPQDKAEATALTYSLGYFLRGLLLIPRVDEEHEVDRRDDRPRAEKNGNGKPGAAAKEQDDEVTSLCTAIEEATALDTLTYIGTRIMDAYRRGKITSDDLAGLKQAGALKKTLLAGADAK